AAIGQPVPAYPAEPGAAELLRAEPLAAAEDVMVDVVRRGPADVEQVRAGRRHHGDRTGAGEGVGHPQPPGGPAVAEGLVVDAVAAAEPEEPADAAVRGAGQVGRVVQDA